MKNLGKILLFILLVSNWNCSEKSKKKEKHISVSTHKKVDNVCIKNKEKEIIIGKILSSDDLQIYLTPLVKDSLEIQLLKNDFLTDSLNIVVGGQKVVLLDSTNLTKGSFKLIFPEMDCKKGQLSFAIWYEFEHADITGKVFKENNVWQVEITGHGIVD
ncbi:MAG: hypothetical protein ACX93O_15580 [Flagellimonas sp.]